MLSTWGPGGGRGAAAVTTQSQLCQQSKWRWTSNPWDNRNVLYMTTYTQTHTRSGTLTVSTALSTHLPQEAAFPLPVACMAAWKYMLSGSVCVYVHSCRITVTEAWVFLTAFLVTSFPFFNCSFLCFLKSGPNISFHLHFSDVEFLISISK